MTTPIVRDPVWHDGWLEVTVSDGEHTVTSRQKLGYDGIREKALAEFYRVVKERIRKNAEAAAAQGMGP